MSLALSWFLILIYLRLPMLVWRGTTLFARLTHTSSPGTVIHFLFFALDQSAVLWSRSNLGRLPYRLRGKKFVKPVKDYYFTYLIVYLLFVVGVKIANLTKDELFVKSSCKKCLFICNALSRRNFTGSSQKVLFRPSPAPQHCQSG